MTRSLGGEDKRMVAAAVVATVGVVESRIVADHQWAYPGLWFRAGCEIEGVETLAGGMRERNCMEKEERCGRSKDP